MFLTYLMLFVALCLSAVAAFYSIIGLTAIFASAVIPIVIMGTMLEVAKLTVTVWLHEYWRQVKWTMKFYLVPAVAVLMIITSMGIFGFLSKAHLDQAVPAGDISAQVQIYDDKIKTQRDNIDAARRALRQMDESVDQTLSRSNDEKGADKAAALRRSQQRERTALQNDISKAQTEIVKLQEQRAPVAQQARKVESEVGPIKYIAALIYGDDPDANLLEKAVRYVIIILVIVFDPLAIFMLLAATESYKWEKYGTNDKSSIAPDRPVNDAVDGAKDWINSRWAIWRKKNGAMDDAMATAAKDMDGQSAGDSVDGKSLATVVGSTIPDEQWGGSDLTATLRPRVEYRVLDDADDEASIAPPEVIIPPPPSDLKLEITGELKSGDFPTLDELKKKRKSLPDQIDGHWSASTATPNSPTVHFGNTFPRYAASKGDLFLKLNTLPTMLYRFNGDEWIESNKNMSDIYAYDDQYVNYLIHKISTGEYDPELLTDAERTQIENRLRQDL